MASAEDPPEDRSRADAALRHLEQGLCVWSWNGRLTYCNPAFADSLGLPPHALHGLSVTELLDHARRKGALINAEQSGDTAATSDGTARLGGLVLICADGRALSAADSPLSGGSARGQPRYRFIIG
jgi:PAS domain-containing protein